MLGDRGVHQRLGEARLVAFVVAEAAVAPHVDDDVAAELLAIFDRQLAAEGHRFGIVAVDVEDRRLDRLGDVRRIRRGARELRAGGEADLVVDDEVDRAAGAVAGQAGEAEAFGDDPLPRERRVAVEQDRAARSCHACRRAGSAPRGPCRARPGRPLRGGYGLGTRLRWTLLPSNSRSDEVPR